MQLKDYTFTSESVSEGHPDKVADRISDSVLDIYLNADKEARVAIETMVTTNKVVLAGEVRSDTEISEEVIRQAAINAIKDIGYEQSGFDWRNVDIDSYIHSQSSDIAIGVDASEDKDEGAGDQGIMFGYACNETPTFMPAPIYFSHELLRNMAQDRREGRLKGFLPDAKSQVSLRYIDGKPACVTALVLSHQHTEDMYQEEIREIVRGYTQDILPEGWFPPEEEFYVNPTGRFVIGGPDGDTGLTGRKIIVDTYGGAAPHGGGAFSGKDPTKVDRSAAYAARYLAKNIVASGLADKCTIQLSYAIGVAKPLSVYINTHGTSDVDTQKLSMILQDMVDLSPRGIRTHLGLNKPIYARTSAYGHFGRSAENDGGFSWEKLDLIDELKRLF